MFVITGRGHSKLAFLRRNLKGCPQKLDTDYRPSLECSCSVWHLHHLINIHKIENNKQRSAQLISNQTRLNCEALRHFFPDTIVSWNSIPFDTVKAVSVEGFKLGLGPHAH